MVGHHEWLTLLALPHSIHNPLLGIHLRLPQILLGGELDWIVPLLECRFRDLLLEGLAEHVVALC